MSENVRHSRKFTTEMLRKLDNLENSPNITREIKAPAAINQSDLPFEIGTHTKKPPHRNLTEDTEAHTSNTLNRTQL